MPDPAAADDVVVLPPVADDPIFGDQAPGVGADASRPIGADPHDFAGLYIKHKWSFQLHARRFLSDRRDIDEVVQESFLKLFLALPELETELQALAYARRTITNLCIDRYRADQRRPRLIDLESLSVEPASDEDELDPVVQAENAAIVREALALLSPLHREALIKREIEEKPLPQIAAELDIPVEQVKHVLHRARRSLRRMLVGTHVEPGVDLDLAMVLAANRERAARAAKPVGASVIALLLIVAGMLGFRDPAPPRVVDIASPSVNPGLSLPAPEPAPAARPPAPAQARQTPSSPRRSRTFRRTRLDLVPKVVKPATSGGSVRLDARKGGSKTPGSPAVTPPPPAPVTPSASSYVIQGVGAQSSPTVSNQVRAQRGTVTVSSSSLSAATEQGTYSLDQSFAFAPDGTLDQVTLHEVVPVQGGNVGTQAEGLKSAQEVLADGAVQLTITGAASALGVVNGESVSDRDLSVRVLLAPDRMTVLAEHVQVVPRPEAPAPGPTTPSPDTGDAPEGVVGGSSRPNP